MTRHKDLQELYDLATSVSWGMSHSSASVGQVCVRCHKPKGEFTTEKAHREYGISGLCESCQNEVFKPPEE